MCHAKSSFFDKNFQKTPKASFISFDFFSFVWQNWYWKSLRKRFSKLPLWLFMKKIFLVCKRWENEQIAFDKWAEQIWGARFAPGWWLHKQTCKLFSKFLWRHKNQNFVGAFDQGFVRQWFVQDLKHQSNHNFAPIKDAQRPRHGGFSKGWQGADLSLEVNFRGRDDDVCHKWLKLKFC